MALHLSILFGGASAEVVSALIEHGADVNYPLQQPMYFTTQLVFGFLALKHRWNQTAAPRMAAALHIVVSSCVVSLGGFHFKMLTLKPGRQGRMTCTGWCS